jgi:hypothetical protein
VVNLNSADNSAVQATRKPLGRPRKPPAERLRARSYAVSDEAHACLQKAAQDKGHSVSKELQQRLVESFAGRREVRLREWLEQTTPAETRALCERVLSAIPDQSDRRLVDLLVISAPLGRAIQIAGLPILKPGVLQGLAECLDCSRFEAMNWWTDLNRTVLPYLYEPYVDEAAALVELGGEQ